MPNPQGQRQMEWPDAYLAAHLRERVNGHAVALFNG
jgi:hypothetical protein